MSLNNLLGDGGDARHTPRQLFSWGEKRAAECRLATLNVQGGMIDKMDEVCEIVKDKRIDVLCVNETKRKGVDMSKHGSLTAIWSGVQETQRACQGVGVILSERMMRCVKDYACVSPRILWVRIKVGLHPIFILCVYAPDMGCSPPEREEFWGSLGDTLNECRSNEKIVMLGDFNSWVGVKRNGFEKVLGAFGDNRVNENGMNLLEVCVEKGLCVMNTMFDHRKIHRYTWERQDSRSMIDFVIVDERLKSKVADTRAYRGANVGTDHYLVMCREAGLFKHWRHRVQVPVTALERIKVERLQEVKVKEEYKREVKQKTDKIFDDMNDFSLEDVWEIVKSSMVNIAAKLCGIAKRKRGSRTNDTWIDDEVKEVVKKKKEAWLNVLACKAQNRMNQATNVTDDLARVKVTYNQMKAKVKEVVKMKKDEKEEKYNRKFSDNFRANVKLFWKQVRLARGVTKTSSMNVIRAEDGCLLSEECKVLERWKGYFESLFSCQDSVQGVGNWVDASCQDPNLDEEQKNENGGW